MTIAEYQQAKQASKNPEDLLETTARLFIKKALDADGHNQYQSDALPALMKALSMETSKLLGAMNADQEEEEEELALDVKSPESSTKKEKQPAGLNCTLPKSLG